MDKVAALIPQTLGGLSGLRLRELWPLLTEINMFTKNETKYWAFDAAINLLSSVTANLAAHLAVGGSFPPLAPLPKPPEPLQLEAVGEI